MMQSGDFGQMGQTCDECSPCWPHRGGFGRCPCDCHPADPAADLEYAMAVIEHLQAENERLRDLVGQHDPTGADHLAEMMEHAQRADALYDENKRLRAIERAARLHVDAVYREHASVVGGTLTALRAALSGGTEDDRG